MPEGEHAFLRSTSEYPVSVVRGPAGLSALLSRLCAPVPLLWIGGPTKSQVVTEPFISSSAKLTIKSSMVWCYLRSSRNGKCFSFLKILSLAKLHQEDPETWQYSSHFQHKSGWQCLRRKTRYHAFPLWRQLVAKTEWELCLFINLSSE